MKGKNVLVNAGPTFENIDPVRFIGNYSSGRMGIAIAEAAAARGAIVTLVLGPTSLRPVSVDITVTDVISAEEMAHSCIEAFKISDVAILSAAVADFTPAQIEKVKIKRKGDDMILKLSPTTDIAAVLGQMKSDRQLLVGFALETDNEENNASMKLKRKNLDLVVLNSLADQGAGFGHDTNMVTLIDKSNNIDKFELKSKTSVAEDILDKIERLLGNI